MHFANETIALAQQVAARRLARQHIRRPVTQNQLEAVIRTLSARADQRMTAGPTFSLSRMIRGLSALKHNALDPDTAESDAQYVRALQTSSTPGSYLIPTITAKTIIEQLTQFESFRSAGARVWPLQGIQKTVIPTGLSGPNFQWVAQNSRQSASDPNFGAINFDLKNLQSFELAPIQMFRSTRPEFDILLEEVYAAALGEAADNAMHASSTVSGAPTALMSVSGITTINANNNNASGGALLYSDLTGVIQKASDLKLRGPYCWVMNGRSWNRVLSLQSTTSQPLVVPGAAAPPAVGSLLGFPAFLSESIGSTEGSGAQSHVIFTSPGRTVHIGENAEIVISLSDEFAFDANQIAIRINRYTDWDFQPAAGIVVLQSIN